MRSALGLLGVLLLPLAGQAHGLDLQAKVRDRTVAVSAYYDDDTAAAGATVRVEGENGSVIAEGKMDGDGDWAFPVPPPGRYKISVNAGDGHVARRTITIAPETPLTDGPTREEFTGPMRWAYAAAGLIAIAGLTFGVQALLRRRSRHAGGQPSVIE
ncbi:carboxypeptidase-like regulatory domain-containing protein [Limnoglobus roseus]|uniref:Carboxypeptidase regulatory-like domain-containing protein n=1 Tax=Limnoglobus roseus TaxID=2598579 RepID=A0A5C1ADD4_9BACT|nr:carboxypeptidase-like regulatory domain-containing protein [Limnoglobus roseus]QEL16167.1 carboxypeptidase regulatory-like domain-containing protein [Limnoglobus roseus]